MKTHFSEVEMPYDGSQLKHLYAYLKFDLLGDSIVSWVGPCNVSFANMADGEDFKANAQICGDRMVHFIVEKFDVDFFAGVSLQRLLSSLAIDVLKELAPSNASALNLRRDGDDIYSDQKKLSISIAKKEVNSVMIHFAVNVVNDGTPVETLCLNELGVRPEAFAHKLLDRFQIETMSIRDATYKVF
jgi:uncharacterized protein